jgi:hypothetical protein
MFHSRVVTLLLAFLILSGCKSSGDSSQQGTAGDSPSGAQPNQNPNQPTLNFSPRISVKTDENGVQKPVMELDAIDASGEKKTISVPLDGLDKSTLDLGFSFAASTPVASPTGAK